MVRAVETLVGFVEAGRIGGIHLEGPFLSPTYCGAHDPAQLLAPDRATLDRLLRAGRGHIRMVTLAAELDGALDLVRDVVGSGAIAAIGHSNATYAEAVAAIDAGASVATHLSTRCARSTSASPASPRRPSSGRR